MVKFGTSGLRGLVADLTPPLIASYTRAFLEVVPHNGRLLIGCDLRPSSPAIADTIAASAEELGVVAVDCGELPTPALALAARTELHSAIMVTGSHIPSDRNGLKFYRAEGEITKADETAIASVAVRFGPAAPAAKGKAEKSDSHARAFTRRYLEFFGERLLTGMKIGVYQHSSVARDLMVDLMEGLGAEVTELARAGRFVPVDTEAVDPSTREMLALWARGHGLDAIISTDGDADRPMLADHLGRLVPGDVLGLLAAREMGATHVVTPVSSNTMIERSGAFDQVERCRIGSPYVIAAMEELAGKAGARVVGFEANGGFLLGFAAERNGRQIVPLMTRDFALPMLAALVAAREAGQSLAETISELPRRFTASNRLENVPTEVSSWLAKRIQERPGAILPAELGLPVHVDTSDGARVTLASGRIVHVRPSGNAPELRCYVEAASVRDANSTLATMLHALSEAVRISRVAA